MAPVGFCPGKLTSVLANFRFSNLKHKKDDKSSAEMTKNIYWFAN